MAKRTYLMPDQTATAFDRAVPSGERSRVVARLVQEWLDQLNREATRAAVVEGCREMAELYSDTAAEWSATDDETWRAL
jgi:hypothetical protein